MRINELYAVEEKTTGKGAAIANWLADLFKSKKSAPDKIEPDLTDLSAGAAERAARDAAADAAPKPAKPKPPKKPRNMDQETWDKLTPKQKERLGTPQRQAQPKPDAEAPAAAPAKADAEAPAAAPAKADSDGEGSWRPGWKTVTGTALGTDAAVQAYDAAQSDDPFSRAFPRELTHSLVNPFIGAYQGFERSDQADPSKPATAEKPAPAASTPAPAASSADTDADKKTTPRYHPLDESNKLIGEILKLSGQRSITERDNVVGITKPKQIKTLTESAQIAECGGIMPSSNMSQPASLNISASAGSGDEVAHMLKSIMQLAGLKPVTHDMMPMGDMLPSVSADPVLTNTISGSLPEGSCGDCGKNPCECAMEETYDNTPEERVEPYDPNNMAHVINKISSKDMATTPYQSASNPLSEDPKKEEKKVDENVYHGLFKAYQEFKNSQ